MSPYYLERHQCLVVSSSESAPCRGPPGGPLHTLLGAVTEDIWAAHRDAKPGTAPLGALHTAQWPAGNRTAVRVKVKVAV